MEYKTESSFEVNIKRLPVYAMALYIIGFIVLNIHLNNLGIFNKDFFILDYLKVGIVFTLITTPVVLAAIIIMEQKRIP